MKPIFLRNTKKRESSQVLWKNSLNLKLLLTSWRNKNSRNLKNQMFFPISWLRDKNSRKLITWKIVSSIIATFYSVPLELETKITAIVTAQKKTWKKLQTSYQHILQEFQWIITLKSSCPDTWKIYKHTMKSFFRSKHRKKGKELLTLTIR